MRGLGGSAAAHVAALGRGQAGAGAAAVVAGHGARGHVQRRRARAARIAVPHLVQYAWNVREERLGLEDNIVRCDIAS